MKSKLMILKKIQSMEKCLLRIDLLKSKTPEEFLKDLDLQDIVTLNLQRLIQLGIDVACMILSDKKVDIPDKMSHTFIEISNLGLISNDLAIKLSRSVGLRNIAVHEYSNLDLNFVYNAGKIETTDYREFIKKVLVYLDE